MSMSEVTVEENEIMTVADKKIHMHVSISVES